MPTHADVSVSRIFSVQQNMKKSKNFQMLNKVLVNDVNNCYQNLSCLTMFARDQTWPLFKVQSRVLLNQKIHRVQCWATKIAVQFQEDICIDIRLVMIENILHDILSLEIILK